MRQEDSELIDWESSEIQESVVLIERFPASVSAKIVKFSICGLNCNSISESFIQSRVHETH